MTAPTATATKNLPVILITTAVAPNIMPVPVSLPSRTRLQLALCPRNRPEHLVPMPVGKNTMPAPVRWPNIRTRLPTARLPRF